MAADADRVVLRSRSRCGVQGWGRSRLGDQQSAARLFSRFRGEGIMDWFGFSAVMGIFLIVALALFWGVIEEEKEDDDDDIEEPYHQIRYARFSRFQGPISCVLHH